MLRRPRLGSPGYKAGYIMHLGGRYIDARDPDGRLVLNTGGQVDVSCISGDGWRTLEESGCVGVAWVGTASLIRFVNDPRGSAYMANCTVCKGYLRLLHPVGAGEELLMHYGEKSFWRFFLNSSSAEAPAVQLSSD